MAAPELRRVLGPGSATAILVGGIIGSGIFLLPSAVAAQVPDPGLILLVWLLGGLLSLAGALTVAELGAMYPRAGGSFVILREAFGPAPAFLLGWMALAVNYTGSIAAIAVAFATYLAVLAPMGSFAIKLTAIACIWLLTAVNVRGVAHAGVVQDASTLAKLAALLGLVAAAFFLLPTGLPTAPSPPVPPQGLPLLGALGLALATSLFAYEGWTGVLNVAEEVRDPARTIPRAALLGVLVVTAVYLLANAAFLRALPLGTLASSPAVAFDAGRALLGEAGARFVALGVVLSAFGAVNAYVLQGPRIYYATAKESVLYGGFARLHPRFATPVFGLVLQAEIASLFVLSGTFAELVLYVVISSWVFYALFGLALFRLRRARPGAERPYGVPGYPWVPAAFTIASFLIVLVVLVTDPFHALVGLALTLSGAPVYFVLRRAAPKTAS